jgi:hypothetical protein
MRWPRLIRIRQEIDRCPLQDFEKVLKHELDKKGFDSLIRSGQKIGLTVGSRNIAQLPEIVHFLTARIKEAGAVPFIIPAMGSHGGATAEGQMAVLQHLGINERALSASFLPSMEVVELGESTSSIPVCTGRTATEVDGLIILNRIKPHTAFSGSLGSGLSKMLVVGLGKKQGAETAHKYALQNGFSEVLQDISQVLLKRLPILLGIAVIEDYYHQIACIRVLKPEEIIQHEPALLVKARKSMGRLPFKELDLLIVDEIGKDISGSGMDTNVIGRGLVPLPTEPRIKRIVVRDLSVKTNGNAFGLGLADFTTKQLWDKINFNAFLVNALTAIAPEKGKVPPVLPNDREALSAALHSLGIWEPETVRVVRIKNTLSLHNIWVSEGLLPEVKERGGMEISGPMTEISFTPEGNIYDETGYDGT